MKFLLLASAFALVGCVASHEPGWTGSNAQPFDHARASCEIETQTTEGEAFETCMASKGWTRLNR